MRSIIHPKLSAGRIRHGPFRSDDTDGLNGAFHILGPNAAPLVIISSDGEEPECGGWQHVSVSLAHRCPNWPEMCFVKNLFWSEEETVVQFHPPESTYISNHPYCLHLWRNTKDGHDLPPPILVGIKSLGDLTNKGR